MNDLAIETCKTKTTLDKSSSSSSSSSCLPNQPTTTDSKLLKVKSSDDKSDTSEIVYDANNNTQNNNDNDDPEPAELHRAVSTSNIPYIEFLLESGADPNEIDGDGKRPMYYSCRDSHNLSITSLLLKHGASMCQHMDWEAKKKVLEVAFRRLDPEKDQAVFLRLLHDCMDDINKKSIERRTVFVLVGWLYGKFCWILCYTFLVVLETQNAGAAAYLYFGSAWFLFVEVTEFRYLAGQGAEFVYLQDVWKWINLTTFVFVLLTTTMSLRGMTLPLLEDETDAQGGNIYQRLVSTTIGFLCVSFLGDVKTTFLPFSIFVGGVAQIFYDVLPFLNVTFMVLLSFSLMYYIQGPTSYGNEVGEASIKDAFYHVFSGFAGGLEDAGSVLDVIFGVVLVIILFNVVIAIVSSSWQNAVNASFINLCKHRVEAIRRAEIDKITEYYCCRNNSSWDLNWMERDLWIDKFEIRWSRFERHSRIEQNRSKEAKTVYKFVVPVMRGLALFVWGILGLVTLGFLWPPRIRKRLFYIHRYKQNTDDTRSSMEQAVRQTKRNGTAISNLSIQMEQERMAMEAKIVQLESKLDDMTSKLDLAVERLMKQNANASKTPAPNATLHEVAPQKNDSLATETANDACS